MLRTVRRSMRRAGSVTAAWALLALAGAACRAADAALPATDRAPAAAPAESAPGADAVTCPSRLLSLMPESWLPAKPGSSTPSARAPATSEQTSAEPEADPASLQAALAGAGPAKDGVRETKGFEMIPKAGPWRGQVGVSAGTHDYWGTWIAVERDIIPDRVTFGFSTGASSCPCWWYRPRPWDDEWR